MVKYEQTELLKMHQISDHVERKFIDSKHIEHFEVLTDTGWSPVTKILKTVPYQVYTLITEKGFHLQCADNHIVFTDNLQEKFVKDLLPGDNICTEKGADSVVSIVRSDHSEHMYDLSLDDDNHRYYTNGILSHNSAILNALSYVLYGSALTNIKKNNLINLTNGKNMLVTLEFSMHDKTYRVERGRSPMKFSLFVDGTQLDGDDTDEAQGESRKTQEELERILGLSHTMFKHIVALNTYSEPFLSMRANDQREIIEHLLGITKLSEKATKLKEEIKTTKDALKEEEFRIKAILEANKRIESNIKMLKIKSNNWIKEHHETTNEVKRAIELLSDINIDTEVENHKALAEWSDCERNRVSVNKDISSYQKQLKQITKQISDTQKQLDDTHQNECPMCGHDLEEHKHEEIVNGLTVTLAKYQQSKTTIETELGKSKTELDALGETEPRPEVFYDTIDAAYNHKNSLESLENDLHRELHSVNPHHEQIEELTRSGLQQIDYEIINELNLYRDHQEFLLKLLTNKDSFIRKKIIDQNLAYLNARLKNYIDKMNLPHEVEFQSDLTVDITEHGRGLDFHNLSRGERTRLILSLSLAFRDVYESLNSPINLLFIDELIDNGLDTSGVESALGILKKMSRDNNKNIYLISHRDELVGRVDNVLRVVKSGGFTSFDADVDSP